MAYTDPITVNIGDTGHAADWNTYLRDNFRAMGPHLIVKKPSDEGPISSTTFQADDHLIAPVAANEVWLFYYVLRFVAAGGTAAPKLRWTFPTGATAFNLNYVSANDAGTLVNYIQNTATSPADPGVALQAPTAGSFGFTHGPLQVTYVNGTTAGSIGLEWAPNAAVGLTMKANSTLWGVKLA